MPSTTDFLRRQGAHVIAQMVDYHVIEYGGRRWDRIVSTEKEANEWMNEIESTLCKENEPAQPRQGWR